MRAQISIERAYGQRSITSLPGYQREWPQITAKGALAPAYSGVRGLRAFWRRNAADRAGTAKDLQRRADAQNRLGRVNTTGILFAG